MKTADEMSRDQPESRRLSTTILCLLARHLDEGRLRPGLVLLEAPLAAKMGTSRAPVRLALHALLDQGRLHRFQGRGALVPGGAPLRMSVEAGGLVLPDSFHRAVRHGRATWESIFGDVERALATALPFGRYRIRENAMAAHYGVSRTVTGDVLGRLHERGLVDRSPASAWIAGPLTPAVMCDLYTIRRLLEPAALLTSAALLDQAHLKAMRDGLSEAERAYPDVQAEVLYAFESALHVDCVLAGAGPRLAAVIRQSQLPLVTTNHLFQTLLGIPKQEPFLLEHRLVVEHLLAGSPAAAAAALAAHLDSAMAKGLARLEILAGLPPPDLPTFLTRV